jgi:uncharacterized protein
MFDFSEPYILRIALGLMLGIGLGAVARIGRFCTFGALEDATYNNDTRRLRSWAVAVAVAIAGVAALEVWGGLDLTRSIYTGSRVDWGGALIGGLIFGFGMALVGTCGLGTLRRIGGGDLRALAVFFVMAVAAMMTLRGLFGNVRINISNALSTELAGKSQRITELFGVTGISAALAAVIISALLLVLAFNHKGFRQSPRYILAGLAVGLLVVGGWWATGIIGFDSFEDRRIESFTFVAPLGETLFYAMASTGLKPDFGVGAVLGVVFGSFLAAIATGQFKIIGARDAGHLGRGFVGAVMMGFGGVTALGCTIGQGVTGVSTLSLTSFIAIASILAGARAGLYYMVDWKKPVEAKPVAAPKKVALQTASIQPDRVSCVD